MRRGGEGKGDTDEEGRGGEGGDMDEEGRGREGRYG